ncbi:hypothetical protein V9T40_006079 [Parthenolecanium corni]|uniref:Alpha-galactosidase n=1 Tax=Parthenolecanium corni TaxID=536013 RepID=A0AAN9Y981_9HEMI
MGWSSWHAYGCKSCTSISNTQCLTEGSIKDVVNTMSDDGFTKAGYEFIILDDGWQANDRNGVHLQPNSQRFPSGMIYLADFIHSKNMKLGLFSDLGPTSGCGLPGTAEHFIEDAETFAHWGVDYVKMSAYTAEALAMDEGDALANWSTLLGIMNKYAKLQNRLTEVVRENKGAWNDADLLVVGHRGVTLDQCRAQMAVWSIMPSPLIFSKHPRSLTAEQRALLKNEAVIKVNQDELGLPGERFAQEAPSQREITAHLPLKATAVIVITSVDG